MKTYLNDGWFFAPEWKDEYANGFENGTTVRIPHTTKLLDLNYVVEEDCQTVSAYCKKFTLPKRAEQTTFITFEGVAHYAEVFVNGKSIGSHSCGYTAFTLDASDAVVDGDNVIVVKVDSRESLNQPPFGNTIDYLTYGGIYRDVFLDVKYGVYVKDVFIKAPYKGEFTAEIEFANLTEPTECRMQIADANDKAIKNKKMTVSESHTTVSFDLSTLTPWSVDNPVLYRFKLVIGGDVFATNFGIRTAKFTSNGFYLNDKKLKIVGLNRHQSFPYVGYAMPESMQRRDAVILKKTLGVNAVRTSHYPQSQYFIDECDKQGLLVFTEIPGWQHIGDETWKQQAVENVKDMILQYRNHPSIVLWGVRINESVDDDKLYQKTNELAHQLDSTRQTGGVRYLRKSKLLEDVYTFNDFNRTGATDRNDVCSDHVPYLVTEYNGHMFPTKSFDDQPHRREHALRYARMIDDVYKSPSTCGCFGWCMFDYNTHRDFGSGDRICYHGVTDIFRNPKEASAILATNGESPVLELCFSTAAGDYPEADIGEMYVITNADKIEVLRGGKLVKAYTPKHSPFKNMPHPPILLDDMIGNLLVTEEGISPRFSRKIKRALKSVKKHGVNALPFSTKLTMLRIMKGAKLSLQQITELYSKYVTNWGGKTGEIEVKAYKDKQLVADRTIGSVESVSLSIDVSSDTLHENTTYDVSAINIKAVDQYGNVVPYYAKPVNLKASGSIEIIGPDQIVLQGGMGGTFVRSIQKGEGSLLVNGQEIKFTVE